MLLETIALRTRVPTDTLLTIAASASKRYKQYTIPKRTGGVRVINHPSRSLKALQRWIGRHVLEAAPVHPAATAYRKGASIRENASRHAGSSFTTRLDFTDFFSSFDARSIRTFLNELTASERLSLSKQDIDFAVRIFCKDERLTIGAPSSPILTNAMMFQLDAAIFERAQSAGVIYTRYADDIFLSGFDRARIFDTENFVRASVEAFACPRLKINHDKTLYLSKAGHRTVTGLIITPDGRISLGRDRKRYIKSLVHKAKASKLNPVERAKLSGLIAFAHDVEPSFIASLASKYEIDVLNWAKSI